MSSDELLAARLALAEADAAAALTRLKTRATSTPLLIVGVIGTAVSLIQWATGDMYTTELLIGPATIAVLAGLGAVERRRWRRTGLSGVADYSSPRSYCWPWACSSCRWRSSASRGGSLASPSSYSSPTRSRRKPHAPDRQPPGPRIAVGQLHLATERRPRSRTRPNPHREWTHRWNPVDLRRRAQWRHRRSPYGRLPPHRWRTASSAPLQQLFHLMFGQRSS